MEPESSHIAYKCLTKPNTAQAHTVHIKNRFNKLTLSSSNKKVKPPSIRMISQESSSSAPKVLSFSSDSSTLTSDEDEVDEIAPKLINQKNPDAPVVNCLLVSSSGSLTSEDQQKNRISDLIPPCEAPTFSQRLEVSDADETKCSMMDQQDRLPSIYAADTLIHSQNVQQAMLQSTLGTQMEKLQITAESEDLFEDPESSGGDVQPEPQTSDEGIAAAQVNIINTLSQGFEKLELDDEQLNATVLTISSSSSAPAAAAQLSTRSSLASEEVYDVITLSDSDVGSDQPEEEHEDEAKDASNPVVPESLSQDRIMSPLNSQTLLSIPTELSDLALDRLDRFFDNIPLINSNNTPTPAPNNQSVINQTLSQVAESTVSSVYISETDDENLDEIEEPTPLQPESVKPIIQEESNEHINQHQPRRVIIDSPIRKDQERNKPKQRDETLNSTPKVQFVQNTESTEITKTTKSSKQSNRTPVVNISAKFQIRIQVAAPNDSSSECSSSHHSSSDRFSSKASQEPDIAIGKVTNRISEMCIISDSNSDGHGSTNDEENQSVGSAKDVDKMSGKSSENDDKGSFQSAKDVDEISSKSSQDDELAKVVEKGSVENTTKANQLDNKFFQTPRSKPRKIQLDKLKTPRTPTVDDVPKTSTSPHSPIKILTEADQRLLNELYGTSWQTPELFKKCKLKKINANDAITTNSARNVSKPQSNKSVLNKEIVNAKEAARVSDQDDFSRNLQDFSMFRKNIANHLDSTRIDEAVAVPKNKRMKQAIKDKSRVDSPFFQKKPAVVVDRSPTTKLTKLTAPSCLDESNESPLQIRSVRKKKPLQIVDSDLDESTHNIPNPKVTLSTSGRSLRKCRTNTAAKDYVLTDDEDDSNSTSDSEWQDDKENRRKSPNALKMTNNLTYLDLTHAEVIVDEDHQAPDGSDQDLEVLSQKLLQSFEYKKPAQFEFTTPASLNVPEIIKPAPKSTKRKLFTPYFDDVQQANEIYDKHDITPPKNVRQTLMNVMTPSLRDGPEEEAATVHFRHGLPKFLQPTNRRVDELQRTEKDIPGSPIKKPATPKSQRKPKVNNVGTPTLPTCVKEIPPTPDNKYGFLRSFDVEISKNLLHPTALMFRDMFKTKKDDLASLLYAMFNERIFNGSLDVPITWNKKLKTTAGYCYSRRKGGIRTAAIDLSDKVITSGDRLRCTLIHELCHAATWIFNDDRGHGATWKAWARKSNATFPDLPPIERCHAYDIEYKYTYQCTLCGAKSHAHSKSKKVELIRCAYCHGAIEIFLNKKTKDGTVCPTPVRKASGFAAFVKVAYKEFKLPGVAHADVMRQLSAKFASLSTDEKKMY